MLNLIASFFRKLGLSCPPPLEMGEVEQRDLSVEACASRFQDAPQPAKRQFGCSRRLADGQWWAFCGETDMRQSLPALCTECGGEFKLKDR